MSNPAPVLALNLKRFAPRHAMPAHCDRRSRISFVLGGRLREHSGKVEIEAAAGSVAFKPGDAEHRNWFGPEGARICSIEVDDGWLAASGGVPVRWQWWSHAGLVRDALRIFLLARAHGLDHPELGDRLSEWIALAQSIGEPDERVGPSGSRAPLWLRRVHQQLHDERKVGLSALAAEAGVHPIHLARRFRRHYRCSVSDYAQALRLSAAVADIANGQSLADSAHAAGYADQAHLTRVFRRHLGLTPSLSRSLLKA
jgi:AraC family transcriptional regulator